MFKVIASLFQHCLSNQFINLLSIGAIVFCTRRYDGRLRLATSGLLSALNVRYAGWNCSITIYGWMSAMGRSLRSTRPAETGTSLQSRKNFRRRWEADIRGFLHQRRLCIASGNCKVAKSWVPRWLRRTPSRHRLNLGVRTSAILAS